MKAFIIIVNVLLGSLIVFYGGVNNLLYLATPATQSTSLFQSFIEAILWIVVGLFSIISALAFRKDKRWAALTLPLPPLGLFLWIVYILSFSNKSELAWAGGILIMCALILLVFLILEISYLALRKRTQFN